MVRMLMVLSLAVTAVLGLPAAQDLPEPGLLALQLNEEEFEDYLDLWLEAQQSKAVNISASARSSGCQFRVNGDLGQPQPVYLHNGNYIVPTGNTGIIDLATGEEVIVSCPGTSRTLVHPLLSTTSQSATATCVHSNLVSGAGWLNGHGEFGGLTCSSNPQYVAEDTGDTCFGGNIVIRVGFWVEGEFYPLFWSCFDSVRLEVLYVWYDQTPPNSVNQSGVTRPSWLVSTFFPGVGINNLYTQVQQKAKIASYVGDELADKYVTSTQFLARGHLCAKTDMIFASGQRATFFFINAAPQWQPFNAGNWNWVEQNLRIRIGVAGYYTKVWTGTWGVSQLRNEAGELVDIYLDHDVNNNPRLPVPLYFYKVVYEPSLRLGTVFISINNPYYTEQEVRQLQFCEDHCRNNPDFSWLNWQPDRIDIGYSFCCTVEDFRRVVSHVPDFPVGGLLA